MVNVAVKLVKNPTASKTVIRADELGAECERRARAICDSANSKLDPDDGYNYSGFEAKPMKDKAGWVVRTKTDHARASQARNNTLLKSIDAGR